MAVNYDGKEFSSVSIDINNKVRAVAFVHNTNIVNNYFFDIFPLFLITNYLSKHLLKLQK